uniref:Upstream activation factor subunit UAF30-like n=1 Tax=Rhizophora mucronata TaxID=61149 RepID=A0A2P2K4B7_RHIMU
MEGNRSGTVKYYVLVEGNMYPTADWFSSLFCLSLLVVPLELFQGSMFRREMMAHYALQLLLKSYFACIAL